MKIYKLITQISEPRLYKASKKSIKEVMEIKQKYLMKSKLLQELFTDEFEYKGNKKGIVLLKNRTTGEPVPVKVDISQKVFSEHTQMSVESCKLYDIEKEQLIAQKDYYLKKQGSKTIMYQGEMLSVKPEYAGAGIRMDQIQIARAVELGVDSIPRTACAQAIIYHTKMGFLPKEDALYIDNIKDANNFIKGLYTKLDTNLPPQVFYPIIFEREGLFFLDRNWTLASACLKKCQQILEATQSHRILDFDNFTVLMKLSGKELAKWRDLLQEHPILEKLNPIRNKII